MSQPPNTRSSSEDSGTTSLIFGERFSVRLPRRMVPIWVSEPIGFAKPLRMASTPAIVVVLTAPRPTSRMPSLPRAGAMSTWVGTTKQLYQPIHRSPVSPAADAYFRIDVRRGHLSRSEHNAQGGHRSNRSSSGHKRPGGVGKAFAPHPALSTAARMKPPLRLIVVAALGVLVASAHGQQPATGPRPAAQDDAFQGSRAASS